MPPTSTQTSSTSTTTEPTSIRLPNNLIEPINYNLLIRTFFEPYDNNTSFATIQRFEGRVIIRFKIKKNTNFFRIHASPLISFSNQTFKIQNSLSSKEIELKFQRLQNDLISFTASTGTTIQIGEYIMILSYSSNFGSITGFYSSKYMENNQNKYI